MKNSFEILNGENEYESMEKLPKHEEAIDVEIIFDEEIGQLISRKRAQEETDSNPYKVEAQIPLRHKDNGRKTS